MTFDELTEYAKNGMMTPNFCYQSEQLAYLTVLSILRAYRDGLLTAQQAREQRNMAEKLFEQAKREESDRLNVYQAYQDNMRKVEEDISRVNRMMADGSGDRRALIDLLVGIVEQLVNVRIRRRTNEINGAYLPPPAGLCAHQSGAADGAAGSGQHHPQKLRDGT